MPDAVIERDLFRHLQGVATANGATGVSWSHTSKQGYPRLVLHRTGSDVDQHTRGESGFAETTVQVTAFAKPDATRSAHHRASAIARAVRASLTGFRGPMGGGTHVFGIEHEGTFDVEEPATDGSGDWVVGVVQEFRIAHAETAIGSTR